MYLVTLSVFLYTLFYTPCQIGAFEWTDSLSDGTQLEVCEGNSAIFPWGFRLASGERVDNVSYRQDDASESDQGDGLGKPIVSTDPHFSFSLDHQMIINSATVEDTGTYVIRVMVISAEETEAQLHETRAYLLVKVSPVIEEGGPGLQAKLQPQAVMVTDGPQAGWHLQLSCGTFYILGQPAVSVTWTTPSGTVLPSTSYENGLFSLIVPNPVESGSYSCQVDPHAPALACISYMSSLHHHPAVRVDAIEARVSLLEARDTELTARLEDLKASDLPSSCKASRILYPLSGIRTLTIGPNHVQVYCDQNTDGGGWTVIQRRQNGQVNFYREWDEYVSGFGDPRTEHWLGLDNIYYMTRTASYTLRVDLTNFNGTTAYAEYTQFSIDGADQNYTLHVSGYSGNAEDSLAYHNNMPFSTYDRDNDVAPENCAEKWHGAWWYRSCHYSNLNGLYKTSMEICADCIFWFYWNNQYLPLKKTEMKLRPVV